MKHDATPRQTDPQASVVPGVAKDVVAWGGRAGRPGGVRRGTRSWQPSTYCTSQKAPSAAAATLSLRLLYSVRSRCTPDPSELGT